jgi:L-fuconolactonase
LTSAFSTQRSVTPRHWSGEIIDAQIHVWRPRREPEQWDAEVADILGLDPGEGAEIDNVMAAMDELGVDAAVLANLFAERGSAYPVRCACLHPGRFRVSPQLDLRANALDQLEAYADEPAVVAIRISSWAEQAEPFSRLGPRFFDRLIRGLQDAGLPLMIAVAGDVRPIKKLAHAYPDVSLVVDHLGVRVAVKGTERASCAMAFAHLDDLLALAAFESVSVKVTTIPTVSDYPYPFPDLWPYLERVLTAFGPSRLMWGSNFTRVTSHSYRDLLGYLRETNNLSAAEKEQILGGSLRRILSWPRA